MALVGGSFLWSSSTRAESLFVQLLSFPMMLSRRVSFEFASSDDRCINVGVCVSAIMYVLYRCRNVDDA